MWAWAGLKFGADRKGASSLPYDIKPLRQGAQASILEGDKVHRNNRHNATRNQIRLCFKPDCLGTEPLFVFIQAPLCA
jgi:hypothetical protein